MKQKTKIKQTEIGMIPEEWEVKSIDEVAEVVGGGTPSTKNPEYWDGDIAWITPKDLSNFKFRYIARGERNITEKGLENSNAKLLPEGTVLLTTRAPVGYVAIAKNNVSTNQGFRSLIPRDNVKAEFLFYLLKNNIGILKSNASGTTFGELSGSRLKALRFAFPDVIEQHRIASILSSLDSKIELNQQMNKTLEEIAQAIFKRWFIDFEFPNENGEPYKSSGGEMVESELGMIPKGWYVDNLGKYVEVVKGCSYSSIDLKPSDTALVTLKSINRGGGFNRNGYKEYVGKYKDNQIVKEGDVLLAQTDLTQNGDVIGRPAFFHGETTYSKVIASLDLQIIRPLNGFSKYFVFYLLDTDSFHEHALSHTNGTTVLHLDRNAVSEFRCIIPKNDILDQFDAVVSQILSLENNNLQEINYLTEIRDLLLPKLMTGKIRVPLGEQNVQ